jgi:hypothetical protein
VLYTGRQDAGMVTLELFWNLDCLKNAHGPKSNETGAESFRHFLSRARILKIDNRTYRRKRHLPRIQCANQLAWRWLIAGLRCLVSQLLADNRTK